MSTLVHFPSAFAFPHFGVVLDFCSENVETDDLKFILCNGQKRTCFKCPMISQTRCSACKLQSKITINKYLSRDCIINDEHEYRKFDVEFKTVDELTGLVHRDVQVGYAALATYISLTRDIPDILTNDITRILKLYLDDAMNVADHLHKLIKEHTPEKIVSFNGRYAENRAYYDISKALNIEFTCLEIVRDFSNTEHIKLRPQFYKSLPHDMVQIKNLVNDTWNDSIHSEDEKINIGRKFFENRKSGNPIGDINHIEQQIYGNLPLNYNTNDKKKINIFCSSEDEVASLGNEFSDLNIFKTQVDGIKWLADQLPKHKYDIFVRIHPNLKYVNKPYHSELKCLSAYANNLNVITAESPISTYSLIEKGDVNIVFNSTVGVECAYFNKPTILCGASFYYFLDVCMVAKTKKQLLEYIFSPKVNESNIEAIKYGYYQATRYIFANSFKKVPVKLKQIQMFGWNFAHPQYNKILNSVLLSKLIDWSTSAVSKLSQK